MIDHLAGSIQNFVEWLKRNGNSYSTMASYPARVRAILNVLACADGYVPDIRSRGKDTGMILEYIEGLSPSSASLTRTAWNKYVYFLDEIGIVIPALPDARRLPRNVPQPRDSTHRFSVPPVVCAAIWELVRRQEGTGRAIPLSLLAAIQWGDLTWNREGVLPEKADFCTFRDWRDRPPTEHVFRSPMTHLQTLWNHAGVDGAPPGPEQYLLAAAPGSMETMDLNEVHDIVHAGRRNRLPVLLPPKLTADDLLPPPVPLSTTSGLPSAPETGYAPPPLPPGKATT